MAPVHLYCPAALLLLVLCPVWQLALAFPPTRWVSDQCASRVETLLRDIGRTLAKKELFRGIDCSKQSLELNEDTQTASVCSPKGPTCSGTVKSVFNKHGCLRSIGQDLHHYYRFLSAQPDPGRLLNTTLLSSLQDFMQKCFTWADVQLEGDEVAVNHPSSYAERLKLCKVLRGFQVRSITINRAVNYMNSGDDTKSTI